MKESSQSHHGLNKTLIIVFGVLLVALIGGGYTYISSQDSRRREKEIEIQTLFSQAEQDMLEMLSERKWPEVEERLQELRKAGVVEVVLTPFQQGMEKGIEAEKRQRLAYVDGEIRSATRLGQWDLAESKIAEIAQVDPSYASLSELRELIIGGKKNEHIKSLLLAFERSVADKNWNEAELVLNQFRPLANSGDDIVVMEQRIISGRAQLAADLGNSRKLTEKAQSLDNGRFSAVALNTLQKALALDPNNEVARALFQKMSTYTRVLRVPQDYRTLDEAIAVSRPRDEIKLGKGTYTASLSMASGVRLRGAGWNSTILTCPANTSSVITIGEGSEPSVISDLALKHSGFVYEQSRYAILTIKGGKLTLTSVKILNSGGHGAFVTEGGELTATNCRFSGSGWSGVAVMGAGSQVDLSNCRLSDNFHNGLQVWDQGIAKLFDSQVDGNARSGASISSTTPTEITNSRFEKNRGAGVTATAGGVVKVNQCVSDVNGVAGLVVHEGSVVFLQNSQTNGNGTTGVMIAKGTRLKADKGNRSERNGKAPRLSGIVW